MLRKIFEDFECHLLNDTWMRKNNSKISPGLKATLIYIRQGDDYVFYRCLCIHDKQRNGKCDADGELKSCLGKYER